MIGNCVQCGNKITDPDRKKYCSPKCTRAFNYRYAKDNRFRKCKFRRQVDERVNGKRYDKKPCWCGETNVELHFDKASKEKPAVYLCPAHHKIADARQS